MKKLTLRVKRRIVFALYALAILVFLTGFWSKVDFLAILGLCGVVGVSALALAWMRCPYCGSVLLHHEDGDYCQKCGKRVFWDNHDLPNHSED